MQLATPTGRPLQGLERFWLAAEWVQPGFIIGRVLEGDGAPAGFAAALQAALDRVADARPGIRLRLRGVGPWLRWSADARPLVRVAPPWEGLSPNAALERPLPLRRAAVEVVWLPPGHLVLRAHHAVADGRTVDAWAHALCAALRGEPLEPVGFAPPDAGLVPADTPWQPPPRTASPVTGPPAHARLRTTWVRRRLPAPSGNILARVLLAIRDAHPGPGAPRVSLPVDLRPVFGVSGDGNLTGIATLPDDALTSFDSVRAAIAAARSPSTNAGMLAFAERQRRVPVPLLGLAGAGAARAQLRSGGFEASLTLSNLGRADLSALSGGGFDARAAWWIPPASPGNPCFLLLSGDGRALDLIAGLPIGLAEGGRAARWLHAVAEAVSPTRSG